MNGRSGSNLLFGVFLSLLVVKPATAQGLDLDDQIRLLSNYHAIMFASRVCAFEISVDGVRSVRSITAELSGIQENELDEKVAEYGVSETVRDDYAKDVGEFCNNAFNAAVDVLSKMSTAEN